MEKVVRDGMVAVLYSPGFGAGWYSWHDTEALLFDPDVVEMVEQGRHGEIEAFVQQKYNDGTPDFYLCTLGARDLRIAWLPAGTQFRIDEYDGNERIKELDRMDYCIA